MRITSAKFVKSAIEFDQCPDFNLPEFVFFGRSNVWKSSLINLLSQRWDLAKCSKVPWKTKLLNFFIINDSWVIVDLPWYWYAKAWSKDRIHWLDITQEFLNKRMNLKKTFLLIDWSIPPQKIDLEMIKCFVDDDIDFCLVFTKIDKCNQKVRNRNIKLFLDELKSLWIAGVKKFEVDNIHWKWREELCTYIESLL